MPIKRSTGSDSIFTNLKTTDMPEISIVETRNIIRAIRHKYDYDFGHSALNAFRYALDRSIHLHHLKYPELLASRILEDDEFFDEFLFELTDSSIELFRDPETWNLLKTEIFPAYLDSFSKPKIWLPSANNGQDLFSLLIFLKIEHPGLPVSIDISALSEKAVSKITNGVITAKQVESAQENYVRIFPDADLYSFLIPHRNEYVFNFSLFRGIKISKQNQNFEPIPKDSNMILFRNNLLNYNPEYQNNIVDKLLHALEMGGYLITGIKENIDDYISKYHSLVQVGKSEKVYKRIK
jgi:chemotaxis methyl-accepting protein methylase